MFGTTLTIAVAIMQLYIIWRTTSVPFITDRISKKIIFWSGFILWLMFYAGRSLDNYFAGVFATYMEMFSMTWMASLFLVSISLFTVDVLTGFGLLFRKSAPILRGSSLVIGLFLSIIALFQGFRPPTVVDHNVYLSGLPAELDGTMIIALSDLHLGSFIGHEWLDARVTQVLSQEPDIIVLLGDIFEGHGESHDELLPVLKRLTAPQGVWAVLGNHDRYGRNNSSVETLEKAGIKILRNSWAEVLPGLVLAGVDNLRTRYGSSNGDNPVSMALHNRPPGATIFLSHKPWQSDIIENQGAGLMLSGHTHGGQIWPFSYFVQQEYPLLAGRYEVGDMTAIVCRGTGTWGPRMRLWHPGEILRLTIQSNGQTEQNRYNP